MTSPVLNGEKRLPESDSLCVFIHAVKENVRRLTAELSIIARSLSEKMIERPHK